MTSVISTVPVSRVIIPVSVQPFPNGRFPDYMLRDPGDNRGKLAPVVSYALQAMLIAAVADGIQLATTGRFRTLVRQVAMFRERYVQWNTGNSSKVWNGVRWWLKDGEAMAATPGTSNHGMGCADDVCELLDGRIISLSDHGLTWLRDNAPSFGFGLETRAERWHWHSRFGNTLTPRAVAVLSWCQIPFPEWMGSLPATPGQPPIVVPDPPPQPEPLPPVDLENGVYGLVGYAISQMNPRPVLSVENRFFDDPIHAGFVQAVLHHEVSRFAAWFAAQEPDPVRKLYLTACSWECRDLKIDLDYGPTTAHAVELMQLAFSGTAYEDQQWGTLVADGVVGAQSWPIILRCATKQWR